MSPFRLLALLACFAVAAVAFGQQADRFKRREPGLILETGARRGNCDALTFTPDGRFLLAAGDDKVVHVWPFDKGKLGLDQPLRWPIWREQRGAIYALALSPDKDAGHIAVAGYGDYTWFGPVIILDRLSGKIEHSLTKPQPGGVIWSLAFSPSGKQLAIGKNDGSVWLWNPGSDTTAKDGTPQPANDCKRLGPSATEAPAVNRVKLLRFTAEDQLIAVVEDKRVLRYDLKNKEAAPTVVSRFGMKVLRAAASPDGKRLVACGEGQVELVDLNDGAEPATVAGPEGFKAESVVFNAAGDRLAVGYTDKDFSGHFYRVQAGVVVVFDVAGQQASAVCEPLATSQPQALAFHPDGTHLVMAGDRDHEVVVWDLSDRKKGLVETDCKEAAARCIWSVGLSKDGRCLSFQDDKDANPDHPNHRGKGTQRVFDLKKQAWAGPEGDREPIRPRDTLGAWKVAFTKKVNGREIKDAFTWYVVTPNGETVALPWDKDQDDKPLCYTFLKATEDKPVRLAVGHYWGFSLFDLPDDVSDKNPPLRVKLFTGHDGEVMAIAPSADEQLLVTASKDQTIAAWSLADWPSNSALGASFAVKENALRVEHVDLGSPAWEAGLKEGDTIRQLQIAGVEFLYDPDEKADPRQRAEAKRRKTLETDPAKCVEKLKAVEPGKQYLFAVPRQGERVYVSTRVKQRPLWRFFATRADRGNEWVLWNWRDYFYAASTNGDQYIGWQICDERDTVKPDFYRADQLESHFHDKEKLQQLLDKATVNPEDAAIPDLEPPIVALKAVAEELNAEDALVTLTAAGRAALPGRNAELQDLDDARLWVNDHLFKVWNLKGREFDSGQVRIPQAMLRLGDNVLVLHCFNKAGARAEARIHVLFKDPKRPRTSNLQVLAVGINKYKDNIANVAIRKDPDLSFAVRDAQDFAGLWPAQKDRVYKDVKVSLLTDAEATQKNLLDTLKSYGDLQAKGQLKPDDCLILFFSGHGLAALNKNGQPKPGSYVFVCHGYDGKNPAGTGLSSKVLYNALAELNCRKLIFLDTCQAGAMDPIRDLRLNGAGPFVLASCSPHETSAEDEEIGHGFFTHVLLYAAKDGFADADANHDGTVDIKELCDYVKQLVPNVAIENKKPGTQTPQFSPQVPARDALFAKP